MFNHLLYRDTGVFGDSDYEYRVLAENETGAGQACKPFGPVIAKDPFGKLTERLLNWC